MNGVERGKLDGLMLAVVFVCFIGYGIFKILT